MTFNDFEYIEYEDDSFIFECDEYRIVLDLSDCSADVYFCRESAVITSDPYYSHPAVDEIYLKTYESVRVSYLKNDEKMEKKAFAEDLGVSTKDLDAEIKKMIKKIEPIYLKNWEKSQIEGDYY